MTDQKVSNCGRFSFFHLQKKNLKKSNRKIQKFSINYDIQFHFLYNYQRIFCRFSRKNHRKSLSPKTKERENFSIFLDQKLKREKLLKSLLFFCVFSVFRNNKNL